MDLRYIGAVMSEGLLMKGWSAAALRGWASRNLGERSGLVLLGALAFYVWMACPYIVENDNAEFATLGAIGGIAHPSGYPLTILWLRAWSWLPASSPAHAAAFATAILGAVQVGLLIAACRAWGARALGTAVAVGLYATAPLIARYNTVTEAFALNNVVLAAVLLLAAQRGPVQGWRRALLLGLVAGLGLSNHMTCALIAPVGLLGVVRATRETSRTVALGAAVGGFLVGLTPYLYCFVATDSVASWRHPGTLGELIDIVLRQQFGGPFSFAGLGGRGDPVAQIAAVGATVLRSWLWLGAPLGLGVLAARAWRSAEGEPRAGWWALLASFVLAAPVVASRYDLPLDMWGRYVVERFHLIPVLLLVIPVALGVDRLLGRIGGRVRPMLGWLVAAGLLSNALVTVRYLQRCHSPAMELQVRNTLRTLPRDAIVIGRDDALDVGFRYVQLACGVRPDVTYVRWGTMHLDWYRRHFANVGLGAAPRGVDTLKLDVATASVATGRPVFVAPSEGAGLDGLRLTTYGVLLRATPAGRPTPTIDEVAEVNRALFAEFDLAYPLPGPDELYATWAHRAYARAWKRIGDDLARGGRGQAAAEAYEVMRALLPTVDRPSR